MKTTLHKTIAGLLLLGLLGMTSCQEEIRPNLDIGFQVRNAIIESVTIGDDDVQTNLWIRTDADNMWTVTTSDDWLSVDPASGTGEFPATVRTTVNTTGEQRIGTVTVSVGPTSRSVELRQGRIRLPEGYMPFRLELPVVENPRWFIEHNYFALEFDTAQRSAVWVAFVFNRQLLQNNYRRPQLDPWAYDPKIPNRYQWAYPAVVTVPGVGMPSFAVAGPFDRAHIIASADRLHSRLANDETFFISNVSPKYRLFNQGPSATSPGGVWWHLEIAVRNWAASFDTLYIVKGPAINRAGAGVNPIGTIPERNNVTIAGHWFMAMVGRNGDAFTGIAFWMENSQETVGRPSRGHARTIRELEHLTGIDFFPNLRIVGEQLGRPDLEYTVETNIDWSRWPGIN